VATKAHKGHKDGAGSRLGAGLVAHAKDYFKVRIALDQVRTAWNDLGAMGALIFGPRMVQMTRMKEAV
jgi:hypothetical protein